MQHLQDSFDGYSVMTTWQHVGNGGYIAYFKEYPSVSAHGTEPQEAVEKLAEVWQTVKGTFTAGETLPVAPSRMEVKPGDCDGKIKDLEIEPSLHYILKLEAKRDMVPIDTLINRKLKVLADWTLAD